MSASSSHRDAYCPLSSQEIRLLKFLPASTVDAEIRCYLTVYPLNSAPPYVALSYLWVVTKPPSFIDLGKSPFKIGPNLNVALKRLRDQDRDAKENYWIDALCIDQENVKEKDDQVQLMGEIYSRCKYVFIWLGEDSTNSAHDALSFIKRWGNLDLLMEIIRPYKPEGVVVADIYKRTVCRTRDSESSRRGRLDSTRITRLDSNNSTRLGVGRVESRFNL